MSEKTTASSGIGVPGLLGVAFVILKLTGFIDWSWFWVLSPFWIPVVAILVVSFFVGIIKGIVNVIEKRK